MLACDLVCGFCAFCGAIAYSFCCVSSIKLFLFITYSTGYCYKMLLATPSLTNALITCLLCRNLFTHQSVSARRSILRQVARDVHQTDTHVHTLKFYDMLYNRLRSCCSLISSYVQVAHVARPPVRSKPCTSIRASAHICQSESRHTSRPLA